MGLTVTLPVVLIGKIAVAEILTALFAVHCVFFGKRLATRELQTFLVLGGLWLAGTAISGWANGSDPDKVLRTSANAVFFMTSLLVLTTAFQQSQSRIFAYVFGTLIAAFLTPITDPDLIRTTTDYRQTVLLPMVSSGVFLLLLLNWRIAKNYSVHMVLLLSATAVFSDARLNFIGYTLTAIALLLGVSRTEELSLRIRKSLTSPRLIFFLLATYMGYLALVFISEQGILGEHRKSQISRMYNKFNPLEYAMYNGRGGLAVGYIAIAEKPLFGHGSGADGRTYVAKARSRFRVTFERSELEKYDWVIPTHSMLLSAWVDGGILGASFFIYTIYFFAIRAFVEARPPDRIKAWLTHGIIAAGLAIILSPTTYRSRQLIPATIAVCVATAHEKRKSSAAARGYHSVDGLSASLQRA
ncbi:hypothetical protein [Crateriforma spongiae]|uniref:hypothetical protein n=1 Tax=Crateriforma spongiae TaxID=2724528 RepID=UPI0014489476|nr:hypothetical protein [Crateriforma spongiae]